MIPKIIFIRRGHVVGNQRQKIDQKLFI